MPDADRTAFVKDVEHALLDAQIKKDKVTLERIISEDYVGINPDGSRVSKLEEIDNLTSTDYVAGSFDDIDIRLHGNTTVVTGQVVLESDIASHRFSFTDVYVDQKLVSSQAALVG